MLMILDILFIDVRFPVFSVFNVFRVFRG